MMRFLIEKEFKLIARNSFLPRMIVMMPIVMMLVLPLAANLEVKNINLAVVDNDHSPQSREMTEKVLSSGYFHLSETAVVRSVEGIERGTTDVIMTFPPYFGRDLAIGSRPEIHIAANAVNAIKASMGANYLTAIVNDYATSHTLVAVDPPTQGAAVQISTQNRFNPLLSYKFYMVPALMVMLLTIMCGFLPALNIVGEKESGTIEQMNVTPVGKFQFILSKLIPYWVIGYAVLTLCFVIAWAVYGIIAQGSYATIYVSAMLFILTVSGLGLVISNFSSTMQQAMFVMFFFILIMLLLSGLFTPVQSMPEWAQRITMFNPLKYFMQIMRGVYLKGSTLADMWVPLSALSGFAVLLNSWAIVSYRKQG